MENYRDTIISQYANSPTINQLIESLNGYIDPRANMQAFYDYVWNVDTAKGFGLDVWGKIVGVSRIFKVPQNLQDLDNPTMGAVTLDDESYRTLIRIKALANISAVNARSLNILLRQLFQDRRCYVIDTGGMSLLYVFEFYLTPLEYAILTQSGAAPKPAGVKVSIMQFVAGETFGFDELEDFQPFDQGTFVSTIN